jgi:hypothetical protein
MNHASGLDLAKSRQPNAGQVKSEVEAAVRLTEAKGERRDMDPSGTETQLCKYTSVDRASEICIDTCVLASV